MIFTNNTALKVDINDVIIVGNIMSAGLALFRAVLREIIVVGSICIDEALMTNSIIIASVATPLWSSILLIALMPIGVAALPIPSKLAAIFILIYSAVVSETLPNKKYIIGLSPTDNFLLKPVCSKILRMPSQIAYSAISEKDSFKALFTAS